MWRELALIGEFHYLVDHFVPLLTTDSDLDGLLHEARRDDNAMKLMRDTARGLGNLRRHF